MFQEANHFFVSGFFFGLGGGGFFFALGSGGPFFFAPGSGGPPFALPLAPAGRGGPLFLVGGGFFFAPPGSGGPLLSPAGSGGFFLSPPALAPKCSQPVESLSRRRGLECGRVRIYLGEAALSSQPLRLQAAA